MARLTVRLPDTLHDQLAALAKREGVSLNQFIVYSLSQHVASDKPRAAIAAASAADRVAESRIDYSTSVRDSELSPELMRRIKELIEEMRPR
jgi:predicted transcriptional regulator